MSTSGDYNKLKRMNMAQKVIRESGLLHFQLARDSGLSRDAFRLWSQGARVPRASSLERIAEGLEQRAEVLLKLAREVRKKADRSTPDQA